MIPIIIFSNKKEVRTIVFFFDPFERSLQASGKCTGGTGGALAGARSSAARNPSSSHVEFLTNQQD